MTESELDDLLSTPRAETRAALDACPGDVIVLGAGGKMGPTLARMVRRADDDTRRVIAVSRWSSKDAERALNDAGVETLGCDLLDRAAVAKLPDAPNVIFMAGQKFGTSGAPATTWAMNVLVPDHCAERYRESRIVAFSTGNVYALTPIDRGGSRETDQPGPVGEYAASCLGRERVFEHYADRHGTRVSIFRLNYAIDLRMACCRSALRVWYGEPVRRHGLRQRDLAGDANHIAIECLARVGTTLRPQRHRPGPFECARSPSGSASGWKTPAFSGSERGRTSATHRACANRLRAGSFADQMLGWVADWVERGGALLSRPSSRLAMASSETQTQTRSVRGIFARAGRPRIRSLARATRRTTPARTRATM